MSRQPQENQPLPGIHSSAFGGSSGSEQENEFGEVGDLGDSEGEGGQATDGEAAPLIGATKVPKAVSAQAVLTDLEAVFEGDEPTEEQKRALDALWEAANDPEVFSKKYYAGKYTVMTLVTIMSLILYIKTAYSISKCDFPYCKDKLGDAEMLIRALIGSISANTAVAWNTLLIEFAYFEKKRIPEVVKQFFEDKSLAYERLKLLGLISFSAVFALPGTTAIFKNAADWLHIWSLLEGGATLLSGTAMNVLPAQIIVNQKAAMAVIAVGMPFVTVVGLLGYAGYKILETCCVNGEKLRQKRLKHLRDAFVERERQKYLVKLNDFMEFLSKETFKWQGLFTRYNFKAEVPEELRGDLSPQEMNTFLERASKKPKSCYASRVYIGVGATFMLLGTGLSNAGLSGYCWSIIGQLAGIMFPIAANPAQVLLNLKWWQWILLEHTVWLPLSAFLVTVNFFSPQAFNYTYKIFTGNWDGIPGYKMFPKSAFLVTILGGYLCWESRYTAVFLVKAFNDAIKFWAAGKAPEVVSGVTQFLELSAKGIAWTNNFSSWVTMTHTVLLELAKKGYVKEGDDDQLFIAIMERVKRFSALVENMDLKAFAKSKYANVQWVSDKQLSDDPKYTDEYMENLYNLKNGTAAGEVKVEMPKARLGLFSKCCGSREGRAAEESRGLLGAAEEGQINQDPQEDQGFSAKLSCGIM